MSRINLASNEKKNATFRSARVFPSCKTSRAQTVVWDLLRLFLDGGASKTEALLLIVVYLGTNGVDQGRYWIFKCMILVCMVLVAVISSSPTSSMVRAVALWLVIAFWFATRSSVQVMWWRARCSIYGRKSLGQRMWLHLHNESVGVRPRRVIRQPRYVVIWWKLRSTLMVGIMNLRRLSVLMTMAAHPFIALVVLHGMKASLLLDSMWTISYSSAKTQVSAPGTNLLTLENGRGCIGLYFLIWDGALAMVTRWCHGRLV